MRRLLVLALVSCTGGDKAAVDTDRDDTLVTDDTDLPPDTGDDDTAAPETDVVDTDVADTDDTGVCAPFPYEEVMALCSDLPTVVSHWGDPAQGDCPEWWEVDGFTGATAGDALDAAACDRSCVYRLNQAVMVLYCGSRGEYLTWVPDASGQVGTGDACPEWFEVYTVAGSGWFESWEAYQEAFPCPGDTGDSDGDSGDSGAADSDSDSN